MKETSLSMEETMSNLCFISKENVATAFSFMADRIRNGLELTEAISETANKFCSNNIDEFKNIIHKMLPDALIEDEVKKENQNLFNKINAEEQKGDSKFSITQIFNLESILKNLITSGITDIDTILLNLQGNMKNETSREDIYRIMAKMAIRYVELDEL